MTFDWMQIAIGAGGLILLQSAKDNFPILSMFKKNHPKVVPAVDALEKVATVVGPSLVKPGSNLSPLLGILSGALSHMDELKQLKAMLTQLHLTPLPEPVPEPAPAPDILAQIAKLLADAKKG